MLSRKRFATGIAALFLAVIGCNGVSIAIPPDGGVQEESPGHVRPRGIDWVTSVDDRDLGEDAIVAPTVDSDDVYSGWPTPNSQTAAANAALYWRTVYVPSDVTAVTLIVANRLYSGGTGSPVTLPQVAIGPSDGAGGCASATIYTDQIVPGDGTKLTLPTTSTARGSDGEVCIAYKYPGGGGVTPVSYCPNLFVGHYKSSGSTLFPTPAAFDGNDTSPLFQMWVGYATSRPRYVVLGDSISVGSSTAPLSCGYAAAAWVKLGADYDLAVSISGLPGGFLRQFADPATYPALWDQEKIAGATVAVQAGVNDSDQDSAATMLANFELIAAHARSLGAIRVIATTVLPNINSGYGGGANVVRLAYNSGLLSSSADQVIDIAPAVWDPDNHDALALAYDSGDRLHPNAAGNVQIEAVLVTALGL